MVIALHPSQPYAADPRSWEHPLEELRTVLLEAIERGVIDTAHAKRLFDLAQEDVLQPETVTRRLREHLAA